MAHTNLFSLCDMHHEKLYIIGIIKAVSKRSEVLHIRMICCVYSCYPRTAYSCAFHDYVRVKVTFMCFTASRICTWIIPHLGECTVRMYFA